MAFVPVVVYFSDEEATTITSIECLDFLPTVTDEA